MRNREGERLQQQMEPPSTRQGPEGAGVRLDAPHPSGHRPEVYLQGSSLGCLCFVF